MNFILDKNYLDISLRLNKTSVEIITEDRDDIEVDFKELRKKTSSELFDISFWENKLIVKEKDWSLLPMALSFFNDDFETTMILKIPSRAEIEGQITIINGDISANALQMNGKLKTINGDIQIEDLKCQNLKIECVSGDTRIANVNGYISNKGVSGRFLIEKGHLKGFTHKGVSGDLYINADFELEEDAHINSVSGDIHLNIQNFYGDHQIYITSLSSETDIKGSFPEEKVHIKKKIPTLKSFPFKDFMPMLKDVFSGFHNYKDDAEVEVDTNKHNQQSDKQSKEIEMILKMVSEGKITIDEAERLIKALKS